MDPFNVIVYYHPLLLNLIRGLQEGIPYTKYLTGLVEIKDKQQSSQKCRVTPAGLQTIYVRCIVFTGTGQLVPKSTRTLVNSYPFLVNLYLSQLVPKSTRTLVYL